MNMAMKSESSSFNNMNRQGDYMWALWKLNLETLTFCPVIRHFVELKDAQYSRDIIQEWDKTNLYGIVRKKDEPSRNH